MADPTCTIEWFRDGFRVLRVFDGAQLSAEGPLDLCKGVAETADSSDSFEALSSALEVFADGRGVDVEVIKGGHADVLETIVTVVFWTRPPS